MRSAGQPSLQILDYVVFGAMFVFTMAIGIRYARKGSTSKETFFVGDRKMHYIPVALSLMVTFESSIMMLGLPAEVYIYGTGVLIIALAHLVINLLNAYISVPLFKPLNITSAYEYLQKRFDSRKIRLCGVFLNMFSYVFYMSIVLYAQAVALEAVVGLNMWLSIFAMAFCAVFYTSLGGIKSVVWTDVFQAIIMFIGIFAVIIKGTIETGGTSKVWEYARAGKRLQLFNFDPDPTIRHTVWTMFLPSIVDSFSKCFSQSTIQRVSASKSVSGAKTMILMAAPLHFFIYLLVVYEGLVVYAFFSQREVEPLSCGYITNPNQILPYAVLVLFENIPGMAGLFMASLYSASLSTISSGLSSMSILVMEDLLQPLLKHTSDARATIYAKISVVILGAACILLCIAVTYVEGPLHQITTSLLSATKGPVSGIFLLACFFPSASAKGSFVGMLFGFSISASIMIGGNFSPDVRKTKWLPLGNGTCGDDAVASNVTSVVIDVISNVTSTPVYTTISDNLNNSTKNYNEYFSLSYCLWGPLGIMTTVIVGILASYVLGRNRPGDVNPKYFLEISDSLLVFLPPRLRRWMKGFGPQFKHGWKNSPEETEIFPISTTSPDRGKVKSQEGMIT